MDESERQPEPGQAPDRGAVISPLVPLPQHSLSRDAPIGTDALCIGCGYNLRGLTRAARCPECGLPAQHALHGDDLCYNPPAWLSRLRLGAWLLLAATLLALLRYAIWRIALRDMTNYQLAGRITAGLVITSLAIILIGILCFTATPPFYRSPAARTWTRPFTRYATLLYVTFGLILAFEWGQWGSNVAVNAAWANVAAACASIVLGVSYNLLCVHFVLRMARAGLGIAFVCLLFVDLLQNGYWLWRSVSYLVHGNDMFFWPATEKLNDIFEYVYVGRALAGIVIISMLIQALQEAVERSKAMSEKHDI
ncbi:MAG: hypothetical protein WD768_09610 [Phycisphaeraceae bacterium]